MKCKFCNAPMEEGQEVCPVCDKNVKEDTASGAFTIEAQDDEAQAALDAGAKLAAKKRRSGAVGWVIAAVLVVAVAVAAVLGYNALMKDAAPEEAFNVAGGANYTVALEEMTEDRLTTVVAFAEKNGLVRQLKEALNMTGKLEEGLTNAQLSMYYWDSFYNFYNNYGYYAMMMGLQPTAMESAEYTEGQTWQEYFLTQALNLYRIQTAVVAAARKEGYVLSEELEQEYAAVQESLSAMEDIDAQLLAGYGPGVTLDDYMAYMHNQYIYSGYLSAKQEAITYTDAELSAYYDANADYYAEQGVEKNEGETAVDSLTQAEAVYDEWLSGEATEESFAALAGTYTTDPGSQTTGGLYENVAEGQMVAAFNEWCFDASRKYGDTGIVETEYGHHIMYFVSKNGDGTINVRHILLTGVDPDAWKQTVGGDYVSDTMNKLISDLGADYVLDCDLTKIALTTPSNITG